MPDAPDAPDELEMMLRGLTSRVDPVPDGVADAAEAAWTWRTIDDELAELAELSFDSYAELEVVGQRSAAAVGADHELTFEHGELVIEIQILPVGDGGGLSVLGQIAPPGPTEVRLQGPSADRSTPVDELGRFRFDAVGAGPMRLVISTASGAVTTDWVSLP